VASPQASLPALTSATVQLQYQYHHYIDHQRRAGAGAEKRDNDHRFR
jgi:hypothetical protein